MPAISSAQRDLLLPLISGVHESPPWGSFLSQLAVQTNARCAVLTIGHADAGPGEAPIVAQVVAPHAPHQPPLDLRRLEGIGLQPHASLRPGRVYSLEELLDHSRSERATEQRAHLVAMSARYGRLLRVTSGNADARMLIVRDREDFSGAAVATLSSVTGPFAAALITLAVLLEQRLLMGMARSISHTLGIGQVAFDGSARVMAADAEAERLLAFTPDSGGTGRRRLQLLPPVQRDLERACASFAAGTGERGATLLIDPSRDLWLALRPADLSIEAPQLRPIAIGSFRLPQREDASAARRMLMARYGLSLNEAAIAHQLSLGFSIVDAGRSVSLTAETSRNYSKRIYAKTGAANQADLVRLILTGLTPLA